MSALEGVALYAALNLLLVILLAYNVTRHRQRAKVSIGTGEDAGLEQACRVHGNAVEYIPVGLIALALLALLDTSPMIIHVLGFALTLGRGLHAYGLLSKAGVSMGRFIGTLLTWLMILASAGLLIFAAIT